MKHDIITCKQKNCNIKRKKDNEKKRRIPDKATSKYRWVLFLWAICCWVKDLHLSVVCIWLTQLWRKLIFICRCLSVGDNFWVKDGGLGLLLSALGLYLVQPTLFRLPHSLWVYLCINPVMSRRPNYCPPLPLALTIFLPPLLQGSLRRGI